MDLWNWSLGELTDTEMKARIQSAKAHMQTFSFFFCCLLALKQTDNLSRTLQSPSVSAAQGNSITQSVVKSLEKFRNEESFDIFWQLLDKQRERIEVSDPSLPRKRKILKRLEDCFGYGTSDTSHFPDTPKSHYRCIYLDVLDNVIQCIKDRFNQPDFQKYMNLQELLLKAVKGEKCKKNWNQSKGFIKAILMPTA